MQKAYPDFYKEFRCIADRCRHNCCIGWEIDVDEETAARYQSLEGTIGCRLRENIVWEGTPHFLLGERERCPFLNERNLCDIMTVLGEENLCAICREHPRFRNELPGRIEVGLGLCCEEAARLILGRKQPMTLVIEGDREEPDEILTLRDELLVILQERDKTVNERIQAALSHCGVSVRFPNDSAVPEMLLSLERMSGDWTELLLLLNDCSDDGNAPGFDRYMTERQHEYENLLVYLIYRHFANAWNEEEAALRAVFAAFGYRLVYRIGAALYRKHERFTFEEQVDVCRLFSAEIEYSEENRDAVLDWLAGLVCLN